MLALSELFAARVLTPEEFAAAQRRAAGAAGGGGGGGGSSEGRSGGLHQALVELAGLALLYAAARLESRVLCALWELFGAA